MARMMRGHRIAGPVGPRRALGERHWMSAAVGLVGAGVSAFGMFGGSSSGKIPVAVRAQMAEEQRRADEAYAQQKMLQPYLLEQMGLVPQYDAAGNLIGVNKAPLTPTQQQQQELQTLANDKVMKGLKGELDIDPAVTRSLNEADAQQKEYLARALGPDYKLSSAGQGQMQKQQESRAVIESENRRGEMTAAESIAQAQQAQQNYEQSLGVSIARGLPSSSLDVGVNSIIQDPYALYNQQYKAGQSTGYLGIGTGLLKGAAGIYGAMRGGRPTLPPQLTGAVYNPSAPYGGQDFQSPTPTFVPPEDIPVVTGGAY